MTEPSRDAVAHAQPARVGITIPQVSIKMRTHLWISWARIALKHEATAHAARQEMQQPGADQSRLLLDEADAGLDGICAAAFALEAFSRELSELGAIPEATLTAWRESESRLKAKNVILEVLAQTIDTRGLYTTWRGELAWLFDLRDSSVHYEGAFAPPEPHPLGMNVAPSQVAYSAENATRAVELLLGILERCMDQPKPPTQKWSQDMRHAVNDLIGAGVKQGKAPRGRTLEPRRPAGPDRGDRPVWVTLRQVRTRQQMGSSQRP